MTEPELNKTVAQAAPQYETKPIDEAGTEPKPEHSEIQAEKVRQIAAAEAGKKGGRKGRGVPPVVAAAIVVVVLAILGVVAWRVIPMIGPKTDTPALPAATSASAAPEAKGPLAVFAKGTLSALSTFDTPQTIADISFIDGDSKPVKLADFQGQVVVLNVWATWCAPCRTEMPTLAHLQTLYAGKNLKVLPLSVDTDKDFAKVKSMIGASPPLDIYADQNFEAPSKYKISGMPATLILDKQGREVARLDGPANWDTPEVQALLNKLLSE